jgi:hypothetical protein
MPKPSAPPTRKRKPTKPTKRAPNYELIDARRTAREQREIVKRTRALRRDLVMHRHELRMLWTDLTRMFTGKFPDEIGLDESGRLTLDQSAAARLDADDNVQPGNVVHEHARA